MVHLVRLTTVVALNWQNNDDSSASETINARKNAKCIVENVISALIIIG